MYRFATISMKGETLGKIRTSSNRAGVWEAEAMSRRSAEALDLLSDEALAAVALDGMQEVSDRGFTLSLS